MGLIKLKLITDTYFLIVGTLVKKNIITDKRGYPHNIFLISQ